MAFHIRNPQTDALARELATLKKIGLTEAVHLALERELAREKAKPSFAERRRDFVRALHAKAGPNGLPADKAFIDSLYE